MRYRNGNGKGFIGGKGRGRPTGEFHRGRHVRGRIFGMKD
jgi:hypothetical protein